MAGRTSTSAAEDWLLLFGGTLAALWRWRLELVLVAVPVLG
jgi:hypothetical protein